MVAEVVVENATARPATIVASHTAVYRLSANLYQLCRYAILLQLLGGLHQGEVRVATLSWASVDKKHFHIA